MSVCLPVHCSLSVALASALATACRTCSSNTNRSPTIRHRRNRLHKTKTKHYAKTTIETRNNFQLSPYSHTKQIGFSLATKKKKKSRNRRIPIDDSVTTEKNKYRCNTYAPFVEQDEQPMKNSLIAEPRT